MIVNLIKKNIHKMLLRRNYSFRSIAPIDLRKRTNDPCSQRYCNGRSIILELPADKFRRYHFSLTNGYDPFVLTAKAFIKNDFKKSYTINKILKKYYELVCPKTATEWLGLNESDSIKLSNSKPWISPMPWHQYNIEQWELGIKDQSEEENFMHGEFIAIDNGFTHFGPVEDAKIDIELNRLFNLSKSIFRKGYIRHDGVDGDIKARVLLSENNYVLLQQSGLHRLAVLNALGYDNIPVRITQVIDRRDYEVWPNVLNGIYTKQGALRLFDEILEAKSPRIYEQWINFINDNQLSSR